MFHVEQQNGSLMRIELGAVVTGENGDDLDADGRRIGEIARHQSEEADVLGQKHAASQRVDPLAAAQSFEGAGHDDDALVHRQELFHLARGHDDGFYVSPPVPMNQPVADSATMAAAIEVLSRG